MDLKGIDIHTHVATPDFYAIDIWKEQKGKYFRTEVRGIPLEETAAMYRRLQMKAVVFSINVESSLGAPYISNDYVARMVEQYPDVFIGFASVDPHGGKVAVREAERAFKELGLRGMKFMQSEQCFFPNDPKCYPIYEVCANYGVPVLFHMGHTGIGAGLPGGGGIHQKYTEPIPYLDDVAADLPSLTIIGAHPAWPWQEEMLAVARHKENVYIDLSGWSPKYFPESLIHYANTLLKEKCLFGSDYPLITPERWLKDFEAAPFRDEVRPLILLENAKRVLRLD